MSPTPLHFERHHLRRDLLASIIDGGLFSLMVGLGETYLPAFILALDERDEIAAGLVTAVPMVTGALLQLLTPWLVRRIGSHKRYVVASAATQAASLMLLPIAAWWGADASWLVFLAASIYWGAGLGTSAAWNTWIEGMVPRRVRTRFFARRVRVSQSCVLLGFLAGGFSLQYARHTPWAMAAFSAVFVVAATCRFASAYFLTLQTEPRHARVRERYVTIRELSSGRKGESSARLLGYLFVVQAVVYFSGPYFAPFMLKQLEMDYQIYAVLSGVTFLGKVLALPVWGRVAHYAGPRRLLWIGGLGIIPISGLWCISRNLGFLAGLQFTGGVAWAAYELAMFLMFFETIPREERTSVLTVYNLGNALAQVSGAFVGALFLVWQRRTPESYLWLFFLSSVGRAAALWFLAQIPPVAISVHARTPVINPMSVASGDEGTIDQPILPSMDGDDRD
ncbi:MAG: MFS transporter [Planctomycetes bacterium]|nr:MFS transporter [Planctomycetota bacterium]